MPSANKSSSISSVKPSDVFEEFNNKIKVVDGGISKIGIESTVLNLVGKSMYFKTRNNYSKTN